jgi:hypothetical protein
LVSLNNLLSVKKVECSKSPTAISRQTLGVSVRTNISVNKNMIVDKKFHIDKLLTTILFILVGTSFTFLTLIPFLYTQAIMLTLVGVMVISYNKNWRDVGKVILGILIGFGSLSFGFVLYVISSRGTTQDAIAKGEPPPQRFDWFIFGPLIGLFFLLVALIYFYRLKTKDTTDIERYFSYFLLFALTIAMVLSYCINFQF